MFLRGSSEKQKSVKSKVTLKDFLKRIYVNTQHKKLY